MENPLHNEAERIVFTGGPSQVVNCNVFVVCTLVVIAAAVAPSFWNHFLQGHVNPQHHDLYIKVAKAMFILPIIYGFWRWLDVRCHRYIITTERLKEEEGVFNKTTDELELFRVKDITFVEPFALRMFGCGNIVLNTSDKSTPIVVIYAIKNPRPVLENLRKCVHIMRHKKGVREID